MRPQSTEQLAEENGATPLTRDEGKIVLQYCHLQHAAFSGACRIESWRIFVLYDRQTSS